ncbi:GAF domain-containing protein [Gordonia sp. zg691]|uniref:LuxR C-terminal-related transcriptional regulator n=1 Tax=Gordonia jinghuaiqii TaxID=2758710 RepID=UPI00166272A2|nr:LuxR C-terminal-related transcriptional regulator [Gordonia jinghuaiqii]MBD0860333.1 GAF domain-containing protein [Gordonia jinghuaiqii]
MKLLLSDVVHQSRPIPTPLPRGNRPRTTSPYGPEPASPELVVRALDAHRLIRGRLTTDRRRPPATTPWEPAGLRDTSEISTFLESAWDALFASLAAADEDRMMESSDLRVVISRLRDLETALAEHRRSLVITLSDVTSDALARLSRCGDTSELVRRIPEQAARLGFDRVLFSTVSSERWNPRSLHSRAGNEWARSYLDGPGGSGFALPGAATCPRPAHVDEPTMLADPHPETGFALWRRSRSKSFWMVPVVHGRRVVGIIHADRHFDDRRPSEPEVDALRRFALHLSTLISGPALATGVPPTSFNRDPIEADPRLPAGERLSVIPGGRGVVAPPQADLSLSHREIEVIELMSEGLTNGQIGRRLTITEGTVKSHVKRILRKTDSSNRAEAVAIWLSAQQRNAS